MRRPTPTWGGFALVVGVAVTLWLGLGLAARAQEPVATNATAASSSAEGYFLPEYQDPSTQPREEHPVANAVGFLLKFAGVLGLIYGVAWMYQKGLIPKTWLPGGARPQGGGRRGLRVLDAIPLKGAQSVHLVEVGDRILVVGSNGKETMVKLAEFDAARGPEAFGRALERAEGLEEDFSGALDSTLRQVIDRERHR